METKQPETVKAPKDQKPQLQCLECGKKWRSNATMPVCGRCNSVDIMLASEARL